MRRAGLFQFFIKIPDRVVQLASMDKLGKRLVFPTFFFTNTQARPLNLTLFSPLPSSTTLMAAVAAAAVVPLKCIGVLLRISRANQLCNAVGEETDFTKALPLKAAGSLVH